MSGRLLIVRHAERPPIAEGDIGNDVTLTAAGILRTQGFARALDQNVLMIHSSPIFRCIQTAQLIADIHDYSHDDIIPNRSLGDPGFFIQDGELAWQSWLSKGSKKVNLHLLTGTETWPGFRAFDEAIAAMLDNIRNVLLSANSGLVVWVTHDTVLAVLASRVLANPLTLENWPDFLGYLEAQIDSSGQLTFTYVSNF